MGLLRKKTSKLNLKKKEAAARVPTPPPQLPPLPGHIRRAEDAASPPVPQKQQLTPPNQTPLYLRRRSRSLWATSDEVKAALANAPLGLDSLDKSGAGDLAAAQPWRSASTWAALHSPARPPSVLNTLVNPCSPHSPAPGWRNKGGGGFFTSSAMDNEITKRTPQSVGSSTPGRTPMSPSRRTRAIVTPSPAPIQVKPRRLDYGTTSGSPEAVQRDSFSSPIPSTPRSMRRRSASLSELTPTAVVTGSSPATPGVLLTPTSVHLLPSLTSRTPSPQQHDSLASVSSASSKRSPQRPLPNLPDSDAELDSFYSAGEDGENETEVIDFSRPTQAELAAASVNTPLRQDGDKPKRSSSTTRSHPSTVSSGSVPPSPRQHSAFPKPATVTASSPSPAYNLLPGGFPAVPSPFAAPAERSPPHAALAAPSAAPAPATPSAPSAFASSPPTGGFIQPRQVSASPTPPQVTAPLQLRQVSSGSTQPQPRQVSNTSSQSASASASAPTHPRQVSNSSHASAASSQSRQVSAGSNQSRQVSAGSYSAGSGSSNPSPQTHPHHEPVRTASSGSHHAPASRSSSTGHSDTAAGAPPHTPDGIAHAINVWRRRSLRRDSPLGPLSRKLKDGGEEPPHGSGQQGQWPSPHPDVFAPTGAWQAEGAYNPYEESAFTDEPEFTPPLRLPMMSGPQGPGPAPGPGPSASAAGGPRVPPRQTAAQAAAAAGALGPAPSSAPRMNILQMQARRPSSGGPRQIPPATKTQRGMKPQVSPQWI